jgi:hypothetical protein
MTLRVRESVLAAIVAALVLTFTVQIHRGDQLPTPPAMMTWIASGPPAPDSAVARCPVDGRDCRRCCATGPCASR